MLMTLYKGIPITLWPSPFDFSQGKGNGNGSDSENLTKGSLLLVASCISWSSWFILQVNFFMFVYIYICICVGGGADGQT